MNSSNINNKRYSQSLEKEINLFTEIRIRKIVDLVSPCEKVLDLGCWDGYIMEKIQDSGKVKKLTGVDNAKSAVERGKKKKLDIRLIKSVDQKLPFPKNSFDCIVAGELIEHLFDVNKFINEIHRVLKPKGELIITTPNLASLGARITLLFGNTPWMIENEIGGKNAGHMRYFTFRTLDKILKKYKFEPIFKTTEAIHLGSKLIISNTFITDKMYYLGREIIVKYKKAR